MLVRFRTWAFVGSETRVLFKLGVFEYTVCGVRKHGVEVEVVEL